MKRAPRFDPPTDRHAKILPKTKCSSSVCSHPERQKQPSRVIIKFILLASSVALFPAGVTSPKGSRQRQKGLAWKSFAHE